MSLGMLGHFEKICDFEKQMSKYLRLTAYVVEAHDQSLGRTSQPQFLPCNLFVANREIFATAISGSAEKPTAFPDSVCSSFGQPFANR